MLQTEYVRNMNCNYERIRLEHTPQEKRYQYCVLERGGIRFLLPCSLRYINGEAFLYYDISSTQSLQKLYVNRKIGKEWMQHFLWGMQQLRLELDRYLLEEQNVIRSPDQVFQDLEGDNFYFLYIPYYEGENGFERLLDFWVEHVDYEDEALVEFVYGAYEKYRDAGEAYLNKQIYEDFENLQAQAQVQHVQQLQQPALQEQQAQKGEEERKNEDEKNAVRRMFALPKQILRKQREKQNLYREEIRARVNGYAVAEDVVYQKTPETELQVQAEEAFGRTTYIEESMSKRHGLYRKNGELAVCLDKLPVCIGKKKEEADLVLSDISVSRLHARILEQEGNLFLEDLNSTNGTYKNGLRLQPYEKRQLENGDEIRIGRLEYIYR